MCCADASEGGKWSGVNEEILFLTRKGKITQTFACVGTAGGRVSYLYNHISLWMISFFLSDIDEEVEAEKKQLEF